MCYNAESATKKLIKYALHRGDEQYAAKLEEWLRQISATKEPKYFMSAYSRPKLITFSNEEPLKPVDMVWGFIPKWVRNSADIIKQIKPNAKIETMFTLDVFKEAAKERRCLVYLDSFYEYHTANKKKKYPFRILLKEEEPLVLGGIYTDWVDKLTGEIIRSVAICTTDANPMMSAIHNEPAASETPRMPVILTKENQDEWLIDIKSDSDIEHIMQIGKPFDEKKMKAYSVPRPTGKEGIGNVPEIENEFKYSDLDYTTLTFNN